MWGRSVQRECGAAGDGFRSHISAVLLVPTQLLSTLDSWRFPATVAVGLPSPIQVMKVIPTEALSNPDSPSLRLPSQVIPDPVNLTVEISHYLSRLSGSLVFLNTHLHLVLLGLCLCVCPVLLLVNWCASLSDGQLGLGLGPQTVSFVLVTEAVTVDPHFSLTASVTE